VTASKPQSVEIRASPEGRLRITPSGIWAEERKSVTDKKLKPLPKRAAEIDEAKAWSWRAPLATKWPMAPDPDAGEEAPPREIWVSVELTRRRKSSCGGARGA